MEIKSLKNTSIDDLYEAFRQAFADYELQLDRQEFQAMLQRRGFNPELSFAAFDGGKIVSFTCNGTGNFYGVPTAYDTGTGTLPAYRGQGVAARVFEYSIPYLKQAGIREYLLEVLQHNTPALSVYRKAGFEVSREFYYFRPEIRRIHTANTPPDFPCAMRPIDLRAYGCISSFWDFRPSWQNSPESVDRSPDGFICLGAFTQDTLIGYCIFEPGSGDITQIAVSKPYRRKGVGSLLFNRMLEECRKESVKLINTDIECHALTAFLRSKNIDPAGRQFEMKKIL